MPPVQPERDDTRPQRRAGRRAGLFLLAAGLCAIPFLIDPSIDLRLAWWITGGGHLLAVQGPLWLVYVGVQPATYAAAGIILVLTLASLLRRRPLLGLTPRIGAFLLVSLALGPGLIVDAGLKGHWDRARPRDLVEFGSSAVFTGPFTPADQCVDNCSFPSGHVAMVVWLVAFAFVTPRPWNRAIAAVAIVGGLLIGVMRMAQGAHFLSDVIFAAFIVTGVTWAVHSLMFPAHARHA